MEREQSHSIVPLRTGTCNVIDTHSSCVCMNSRIYMTRDLCTAYECLNNYNIMRISIFK